MISREKNFKHQSRSRLAAAALLIMLLGTLARAQSATATLTGAVIDEAGAVVPGVRITVLNLSTALERHAATNGEGVYVVPLLPVGRYNLTAQRDGFTTVEVRAITLNVSDQLALRIRLRVGEIGESVTVVDNLEGLGVVREGPSVSAVVNRPFVENLPLNGRSFQTLFELTPGTTLTHASFSEQGQFSAAGQRANANYFMVDGVSANIGVSAGAAPGQSASGSLPALTVLGGANNLVSVEALEEFRIQTSSYAPEFGRTSGAQISVVTRSGTNEWHGSVFDYVRHEALDANDWFANSRDLPRARLRQHDFGATLGGPLRRDRTFFFASYEGLRLRLPQVAITDVPSTAARQSAPAPLRPFFDAFPVPTGADLGNGFAEAAATYSDRARFDAASVRIDHVVMNRLTFFGRYNYAPSDTVQRGGVSLPDFTGQSLNTVGRTRLDTQTLTAGATFAPAPNVLGDLRFNWSRAAAETTLALDDFGGARAPADSFLFPPFATPDESGFQFILRGGTNSNLGTGRSVNNLQRQLNSVGNLSVVRGRHHFRMGADFRRLAPVYGPLRYSQSVVFGDTASNGVLAAISTGRAFEVRVGADAGPRTPVFTNFSAYAQDTARITPRLTITYGLRWELNPPPRESNDNHPVVLTGLETADDGLVIGSTAGTPRLDLDLAPRGTPLWQTSYGNFAPRVGVAYRLLPERGTVLRGGVGIFYDLGTGQAAQAFGSVFPFAKEKVLSNVAFPLDPAEAVPPPVNLNPPFGTIYAFVPSLRLPFAFQWNAGLEHPLGAAQSVSAAYVGASGRSLLRQRALLRPEPRFTVVRVTDNSSSSRYDSLQLQFIRRLSGGLQAHASYTFARSTDNDSDDSSSFLFTGSSDPEGEHGPSNFDVRHSLTAAVTYNLPRPFDGRATTAGRLFHGWAVDTLLRARTAVPINVITRTGTVINELVEARRPDLVSGVPIYVDDPEAPGGRRLNRAAFVQVFGRQGTLGRNAVRGFGFSQIDLALRREFRLSERARLQLRAEVFNLFNRPSFGDPVADLANPRFGLSTQTLARSLGAGGANGGLSPLYQVGGPRSVQLALKVLF
ncbi:MAG TPA: TonB-dependent receptor [Pyrinomonadaceae bacterium]